MKTVYVAKFISEL